MSALRTISIRGRRPIAADRIKALSLALREEFSTPFSFYDGSTGELLGDHDAGGSPAAAPGEMPAEVLAIAVGGRPHVGLRGGDLSRLVLPIQEPDVAVPVAIGDLPALAPSSQASRLEQARLQEWVQSVHSRLSFSGCSVSQPRSDQPHLQQLRTLLEASKEITPRGIGDSVWFALHAPEPGLRPPHHAR
jgi:hypothetical protein